MRLNSRSNQGTFFRCFPGGDKREEDDGGGQFCMYVFVESFCLLCYCSLISIIVLCVCLVV